MPITRDQDNDERMEVASKDSFEERMKDDSRPAIGSIERTFSFDDHLPVVHCHRASSARASNKKCLFEDDDRYIDGQPSFTIPITYSNEGSNRSKVVYPVSVPASP